MAQENILLKSLLDGDSKGILEIYESVFPMVLKYVVTNSGDRKDAEDVFQRALMYLVTKIRSNNEFKIENFEWYIVQICRNLWLKELNSQKKWVKNQQNVELIYESHSEKLALEMLELDKRMVFKKNFDRLSDNCQTVLKLFLKKKSLKEIKEILGYSSDHVAGTRIHKCKAKLSSLIKKDPMYKKIKNI